MDKNMWKTWSPHVTATPRQNVCVCVFSDLWEPKTYDLILMICLFSICYVMLCVITRTLQGFGRKHIISSKEAIAKTVWISDVDQGMTFCALHAVFDPKMPEADKTKRVIRLKMIPPYFPASQDGPPQDGKRILLFHTWSVYTKPWESNTSGLFTRSCTRGGDTFLMPSDSKLWEWHIS